MFKWLKKLLTRSSSFPPCALLTEPHHIKWCQTHVHYSWRNEWLTDWRNKWMYEWTGNTFLKGYEFFFTHITNILSTHTHVHLPNTHRHTNRDTTTYTTIKDWKTIFSFKGGNRQKVVTLKFTYTYTRRSWHTHSYSYIQKLIQEKQKHISNRNSNSNHVVQSLPKIN